MTDVFVNGRSTYVCASCGHLRDTETTEHLHAYVITAQCEREGREAHAYRHRECGPDCIISFDVCTTYEDDERRRHELERMTHV